MTNREELLRKETYKEDSLDLGRRVFYTLNGDCKENLQAHRNSKAIAVLIEMLHRKGIIDETEIDELLLEAID